MKKWLRKILVGVPIILIICLVGFLFRSDLEILLYQIGVSTRIISADSSQVNVFADSAEKKITEGYVEYLSGEQQEEVITYPSLPSVRARLRIDRVKIDGPLVEGQDESAMNNGFWHYPSVSPYDKKGNSIIIGHRYLKLPPHKDTFYNLDKVKAGDIVIIDSLFGTVKYKVRTVWLINATEVSVLEQTENAQLTLITCHPLWTSKQRLVIIADQIERNIKE